MARLLLSTDEESVLPIYHHGVAQIVPIPCYHPFVRLALVPPAEERAWRPSNRREQFRSFEAIVDTGASLTNLPFGVWTRAESEIRWLDRVDSDPVAVGGTTHTFRLGRVLLAATDWQGRWLPPAWTLAHCLDDTDEPIPALLGLMSPFLMSGRRMRHDISTADRPEWWLEDG